ncbi:NADP-dependent oxidoreductase [Alteromonas oceanisediminis]|uniref:NADP-dependent oxidoreductase n=1 Tax=Alteromonas oceanisediminis TaxID=2836180 RepID=UPI001BD938A4|nr:NADP-dependent oxidoreductase [Alteromonas oceanisediminis]MBT0586392.1 NADP-dependent oxidoreductase [Alteromonas oceanisediminis]
MQNRQFLLASRPVGEPTADNWTFTTSETRALGDNEILVRIDYISLDPAMRGWMNEGKSYIEPVAIGDVMRAGTVGEVIESSDDGFAPGDFVYGHFGVQDYAVVSTKGVHKVDPSLAPLERYLGVLGMPGMTAYFGILDTGMPKEGETVVVSGAAGAVGTVVGQIAKIKGCRVVGIAGGKGKCQYLIDELGFDGAIDYKNEDVKVGLKRECPKGVDVYFDNVGGDILDSVLTRINLRARIVICGAISQYNNTKPVTGPSNYLSLLVNRARMEGIVVFDNAANYGKAAAEMAGWIAQGKLKAKEHVVEGLEKFPEALMMLFNGENFGKLVLKVDHEAAQ